MDAGTHVRGASRCPELATAVAQGAPRFPSQVVCSSVSIALVLSGVQPRDGPRLLFTQALPGGRDRENAQGWQPPTPQVPSHRAQRHPLHTLQAQREPFPPKIQVKFEISDTRMHGMRPRSAWSALWKHPRTHLKKHEAISGHSIRPVAILQWLSAVQIHVLLFTCGCRERRFRLSTSVGFRHIGTHWAVRDTQYTSGPSGGVLLSFGETYIS